MLILASASPRRKELLSLITKDFEVIVSGADESCSIKDPAALVRFLAEKKAESVFETHPADTVIGADTVVEADGEIFGKPVDEADARRMLRTLSANTHFVHTGLCVQKDGKKRSETFTTKVMFRPLIEGEIDAYLQEETVMDKAGAYAIQGPAAKFVKGIEGCFYNAVGLPVSGLWRLLFEMEAL